MTKESRQFITLDEVKAIRYTCRNCGVEVIVPRQKWGTPQRYCPSECSGIPNSPQEWVILDSAEDKQMKRLQDALKGLIEFPPKGCTISFEIPWQEKN